MVSGTKNQMNPAPRKVKAPKMRYVPYVISDNMSGVICPTIKLHLSFAVSKSRPDERGRGGADLHPVA